MIWLIIVTISSSEPLDQRNMLSFRIVPRFEFTVRHRRRSLNQQKHM